MWSRFATCFILRLLEGFGGHSAGLLHCALPKILPKSHSCIGPTELYLRLPVTLLMCLRTSIKFGRRAENLPQRFQSHSSLHVSLLTLELTFGQLSSCLTFLLKSEYILRLHIPTKIFDEAQRAMENSKLKSLTDQVLLLLRRDKEFPQKLKQRLVLESDNMTHHYKFIAGLFTGGVLCDGSSDPVCFVLFSFHTNLEVLSTHQLQVDSQCVLSRLIL